MRIDIQNDPIEVMKLQAFLKVFEGYDYVQITGTFDQPTFQAVSAFQMKYFNDILAPWGHTAPTGYVYILTLKKINELYCLHTFPLNEAQAQEIVAFRALISGFQARGYDVSPYQDGSRTILVPVTKTETVEIGGESTTTATSTISVPIVGAATTTNDKGQNTASLAAVLFAAPQSVMDGLQCIYELMLILIVLYILGNVLEDVLYKTKDPSKARAKFFAKWLTIALGLVVAMIVAYMVGEWCLMLPLLIALILSLVWMALYPKHNTLSSDAKVWYATTTSRAKDAFSRKNPSTPETK